MKSGCSLFSSLPSETAIGTSGRELILYVLKPLSPTQPGVKTDEVEMGLTYCLRGVNRTEPSLPQRDTTQRMILSQTKV